MAYSKLWHFSSSVLTRSSMLTSASKPKSKVCTGFRLFDDTDEFNRLDLAPDVPLVIPFAPDPPFVSKVGRGWSSRLFRQVDGDWTCDATSSVRASALLERRLSDLASGDFWPLLGKASTAGLPLIGPTTFRICCAS